MVDFQCNKIGDEGVKYLSNALQHNRVKQIFYLFIIYLSTYFQHRLSQHLIYERIYRQ